MKDTLSARNPQRMKFTERSIKTLKRDPARAEYVVWSADMPGFGCRLRGNSKTYIDQTRVHSRVVKNTIGDINKISLDSAIKIARKHLPRRGWASIPAPRRPRPRWRLPRPS
jgi:hypothetical protein